MRFVVSIAIIALLGVPAFAVLPGEELQDPVQEERARAITAELRCLVCDNESIDASSAPLAKDLRLLVRERIVAGDTDSQVRSLLVDRYGDYVLLRPPMKPSTWILWFGPLLLGLVAALYLLARQRSRSSARLSNNVPLTDEEEAELQDLQSRIEQGK